MSTKFVGFFCVVALLSVCSVSGRRSKQVDHKGNWIAADGPLVNLELYFETLCPDSIAFITKQLYPTALKIGSIMNITVFPYGNAKEAQDGNQWVFTCQHGPKECATNLIETCALNVSASQGNEKVRLSKHLLDFIFCIESNSDPSTAAQKCAQRYELDWNAITSCTGSPLGNQLEHIMALYTDALNPPHNWVPWLVVNGVHNAEIQAEGVADLIQLICDTYTGTRPQSCPP